MPKRLYVPASPRHGDSISRAIGDALVKTYRERRRAAVVGELHVWSTDLPALDRPITGRQMVASL